MKKKIRINEKFMMRVLPLVLLSCSLLCWPLLFYKFYSDDRNTANLIEKADALAEKKVYAEARDLYEEAVNKRKDNYSLWLKLARCCLELDEKTAFLAYCENAITLNQKEEEAYLLLSDYYYSCAKYSEVYNIAQRAEASGCVSLTLEQTVLELDEILVSKYLAADTVKDWHQSGDYSYAVFERNGKYGILRSDGNVSMDAAYDWLGAYSSESRTIPALDDGDFCYIDKDGLRRAAADVICDSIGSFSGGGAPFNGQNGGGYLSADGAVILSGLEYAGAFSQGIAAIKKNGKWALIDSSFCSITGFEFDGILCDSNGCCSEFTRCVVISDGKHMLCDLRGRIVSEGFDEIKLPASDSEAVAYRNGDKWGFISTEGKIVIEAIYDDAASFSQGLAPVYDGSCWYYINSEGKRIGTDVYEYAAPFSRDGCAIVRKNGYTCALFRSRRS